MYLYISNITDIYVYLLIKTLESFNSNLRRSNLCSLLFRPNYKNDDTRTGNTQNAKSTKEISGPVKDGKQCRKRHNINDIHT